MLLTVSRDSHLSQWENCLHVITILDHLASTLLLLAANKFIFQ